MVKKGILKVTGMHCASCALLIEKNLKKKPGVINASVNYGTEKATIDYDESKADIKHFVHAIREVGYDVIEESSSSNERIVTLKIIGMDNPHCVNEIKNALQPLKSKGILDGELNINEKAVIKYDPSRLGLEEIKKAINNAGYKALEETSLDREREVREEELRKLKNLFLIGLIFSIPIVMLSFPEVFKIDFSLRNFVLLILTTPVQFYVGARFYRSAWGALKARSANMDSLIVVGTTAAYIYSLFVTFTTSNGATYFDTASVIITFIVLGKFLESKAKGKTSEAIKKLIGLQAKTATVIRDKKEIKIPIEEVRVNDIVIIKPGEKIPVDGLVVEGGSSVDESMITGESIPVEKKINSIVIGGTINKNGLLKFKATKVGKDTTLAQIIKMVEEAQGSKAPIQRLADKVSSIFVPVVIVISLLTFFVWFFFGPQPAFTFALSNFVAVLIIACPCALGLATPTAIIAGTGKGAEHGILIRGGEALETAHKITTVVFDKTGTLTKGKPEVTDVLDIGKDKNTLKYAAIAEKGSEHPLGDAIINEAKKREINIPDGTSFKAISGKGVQVRYLSKNILLGNRKLMEDNEIDIKNINDKISELEEQGKTVMILALDKKLYGLIAVADTLKENSRSAVYRLQRMNKEVVMITGDNKRTAHAIARQVGIRYVLAEVLPGDKANEVKKLQKQGRIVAMVGDGINDAPALAQADVGIALGSGTDVAKETGDIVLIKSDLMDVVTSIDLSSYTIKKIRQNLFWAFFYNSAGIPIAAGILYPFFGFLLNPMIAAAAMALSSVSVVSNSLLMRRYKGIR
ncbi:heavy metal translocating P-type ATPase [Candidatus Woesearchaeota archaeon]|nr:heavy metal translocating P-type ATPase [Candidatus Woesearchaeota archaeon]